MTVINFTVTLKGLEDQLLVDVVRSERPDLEERKDKLVLAIARRGRLLVVLRGYLDLDLCLLTSMVCTTTT